MTNQTENQTKEDIKDEILPPISPPSMGEKDILNLLALLQEDLHQIQKAGAQLGVIDMVEHNKGKGEDEIYIRIKFSGLRFKEGLFNYNSKPCIE